MFNPFAKLFGGIDVSAMIGPMLPGIIKDASPKIIEAFDSKVLELENADSGPLIHDDNFREEIAAFVTKRNGQLQVDWVVLTHERTDKDDWNVEISAVLETVTQEQFFASVLQSLSKGKAEPLQIPMDNTRLHALSEKVRTAPAIDLQKFEEMDDVKRLHKHFAHYPWLAVRVGNRFGLIQPPLSNEYLVWYGSDNRDTVLDWIEAKNQELDEACEKENEPTT
jgi:hypothetical protein